MSKDFGVLSAALKRRRGKSVDLDGVLNEEVKKKGPEESTDADGTDGLSPGRIDKITAKAPIDPAAEEQWAEGQSPTASDSPAPMNQAEVNTLDPDSSGEVLDEGVYDQMVDHKRLDYLESQGINSPKTLWDKVQLEAKKKRKKGTL